MEKPNFYQTHKKPPLADLQIATKEQELEHCELFCYKCSMLNYCKHKTLCAYLHAQNYTALHNAICLAVKAYNTAFYFCTHATINMHQSTTENLSDLFLSQAVTLHHAFTLAEKECAAKNDVYSWKLAKEFLKTILLDTNCIDDFCEMTECNFWN